LVNAGIWKLRGRRKCLEKGRCPLYTKEEDDEHILLKRLETRTLREKTAEQKMIDINEEIVYTKIITCVNILELRNVRNYP
jgi:hypothetical protein